MPQQIDDAITFRKLEVLLAFLEAGSLSRAAEQLRTSAVSVHRALHSLEEGVQCQLFRLEGRQLQPLEAAHALADTAREVLRAMEEGLRATRAVAGYGAASLRIGSLYSLTHRVVPALVMGLKLRRSDLQTELLLGSNDELLQKLRDGAIDASLMALPEGAPDVEMQPLFEDEVFFAAPAGSRHAAEGGSVDLAACAGEKFVSLGEGFATYRGFMEGFRIAGFEPDVVMTTGDIFSLMNLVGGGIGCTLLPGRVRSVMPPSVRLLPLQPRFHMRQQIGLCFLRTRERDPNLLALLAVCRTTRFE